MKLLLGSILAALLVSACHKKSDPASPGTSAASVAVTLTPATLETHQASEDVVGTVRSKLRAVIEAKRRAATDVER